MTDYTVPRRERVLLMTDLQFLFYPSSEVLALVTTLFFCVTINNNNNNNNNNNSEVLLGAIIQWPDAPLASQERKESEN